MTTSHGSEARIKVSSSRSPRGSVWGGVGGDDGARVQAGRQVGGGPRTMCRRCFSSGPSDERRAVDREIPEKGDGAIEAARGK
jgi:hypothetical protein